jgi:hypothetical protein
LHLYQFSDGYESGDTRTPQFLKMIVLLLLSAFQFSKPRISSPPRLLGESLVSLREQPSAESRTYLYSSYKGMIDRKGDRTAEEGGASGNEHGSRLPLGELFLSDLGGACGSDCARAVRESPTRATLRFSIGESGFGRQIQTISGISRVWSPKRTD